MPIKPFHHFYDRLLERYGITITVFDYLDLIQAPAYLVKDNLDGTIVCYVRFNGKKILAVKQKNKNKFLLTALPEKNV